MHNNYYIGDVLLSQMRNMHSEIKADVLPVKAGCVSSAVLWYVGLAPAKS